MPKLLIGPFSGEFGWELCTWNPIARRLAREAREAGHLVAVAAPLGSRYLYEFADEFHEVHVRPETSEGLTGQMEPEAERALHKAVGVLALVITPDEREHGDPDRIFFRQPELMRGQPEKEFRRLGTEQVAGLPEVDVCVAFRPPKQYRGKVYAEKSWPLCSCLVLVEQLRALGLRVAAVGGRDNWAPGVPSWADFRGRDLELQACLIARSRLVIGPSSGPLHLASLCGTPHLTWYGRGGSQGASSRARYERVWNPFHTTARFLDSLCPEVSEVLQASREMLG